VSSAAYNNAAQILYLKYMHYTTVLKVYALQAALFIYNTAQSKRKGVFRAFLSL